MSTARIFKVKTSLARKLDDPGGRLVREAERKATEALETHRGDVMETIRSTVEQLHAVCQDAADDRVREVYDLACSIIDLAGFFDTGPLYDAAYSLCDVSDRMLVAEAWRWPVVQVHVQALVLILHGGCRIGQESDLLLDGLRSVAAHAA